jgi:hypothetical protein
MSGFTVQKLTDYNIKYNGDSCAKCEHFQLKTNGHMIFGHCAVFAQRLEIDFFLKDGEWCLYEVKS